MNKFDFGSYFGQDFSDVVETDPHYIIYCWENIKGHGIPEEVYERAIKLVHDELDALDLELDREGDSVVVLHDYLGPQEEFEFDDIADYEQCF